MQHTDILFFMHKSELSIYTYENGQYTPCYYKGDKIITIDHNEKKDWGDFWEYIGKEFLRNPWKDTVLSILYHDVPLKTCFEAVNFPCERGLTALRIQDLGTALPELLCKMDILKQNSSPVRFADTFWQVNSCGTQILLESTGISAYKLIQEEIVKAYIGAFPTQGQRQMEPASLSGKSHQALNAFIETSKVEPRRKG